MTFAVGLSTSVNRVVGGLSHASAQPVQVYLSSPRAFIFTAGQQRAFETALSAQPGTAHYAAETGQQVGVAGLTGQYPVTAFRGTAGWTGYPMIHGHWYTGPGQIDASTGFLTMTGKAVGDPVTLTFGTQRIPVTIVGEVFSARDHGISVITDWNTLAAASPGMAQPDQYDVGLRPGTSSSAYAQALGNRLGRPHPHRHRPAR